jgi:hypothetical protein
MPTDRSEEPFDCAREGEPIFVVHRHSARSDHDDLALEGFRGAGVACGAQGPSMDPRTIGPVAAGTRWATTRR